MEEQINKDSRPRAVIEAARKFATGEITAAARDAARVAAKDASWAAAMAASRAAAMAAARDASRAAAWAAQAVIIRRYLS